jgi:hypothetical protein
MPRPIGASSSSGHGATSGCGANISAPNAAHSQEDNDDDSFAQVTRFSDLVTPIWKSKLRLRCRHYCNF